ncbi:hypothetical protein A3F59_02660 [Candidatus Roizmanbacteria bacterium RIFCSPHIGHO2_12_FULL_38_13]|nr:MAG: hypothetical protein A3F59_02660 [Candidatus Roizmanbacteria bacterium RIFCSPHIGHO2_12_FULL_38_13]
MALVVFVLWDNEYIYEAEAATEPVIIRAEVTQYTPSIDETDLTPLIMADGSEVRPNSAACPEWLEFGQRIAIDGIEYVCRDRMALRYRNGYYFDILSFSKEEALEFGRQIKNVLIIN